MAETAVPAAAPEPWYLPILAGVTLVVATAVAYHNSFAGPFIFDDTDAVLDNPTIRRLWPLWEVLSPPTDGRTVTGRPVLNLSFALNYAMGGTDVGGYHAANLAIHALAALLLFGVVRRTLRLPQWRDRDASAATLLATATAMLWVVHPLQTQAVTYVAQRAESLAGLFYLLTLYCVLRGSDSARPRLWDMAAVLGCWLGLATKETCATAPLAVLLYDRVFLAGSYREALRRRPGLYLGLIASWGLVVWGLIRAGGRGGTVGSEVQAFTWASYLLTQPGVIAHYLRLSFWPSGQSLDYAWPAARTVSQIVPPALLVLGLAGLTAWALRRRPSLGFIGAWFFLILAPTSSFVPLEDAAFEHRMYLALAAVVLLTVRGGYTVVAWGATRFPDVFRGRFTRRVTLMLPVAVVAAALTGATISRNRCYRTELAIWQDAADKSPANARAHNNLGNALDDAGQVGEAIRHYREALRWKPDYPDALNNLGAALASTGKVVEAVGCFREALEQKPDFPEARCNLDTALRHIHGTGPASYPRRPAHPPPAEAPQPQRN